MKMRWNVSKQLQNFNNSVIKRLIYSTSVCCQEQKNLEETRKKLMARGLPKRKEIPGVKKIIMVASGKGGVGKSTVTVNLALAFKSVEPNKQIGILDADVYGPSIPLLMNLNDAPLLNNKNKMLPLQNYGIKCISMGFLIDPGQAVVWRGLMVMQALEKLMHQVEWGDIDYLIVDTPPGTGDTHLTIFQQIPVSTVLIVTTPQKPSLQVAARSITMYKTLNLPIMGVIKNMSHVLCPNCSTKISFENEEKLDNDKENDFKILQNIPFDMAVSLAGDTGKPVLISDTNGPTSNIYKKLAVKIISLLE